MGILRYPGSKRKLLPALDVHLRPFLERAESFHDVFVGGASVLLWAAREFPNLKLYANDLDRGISDILRAIVGPEGALEALEEKILGTVPTVKLRDEIKRREPVGIVENALAAIVVNRTSFSGIWSAGPLGGRDQRGNAKIDSRWIPERLVRELRQARDLLKDRLEVASLDAVAYVTCMLDEDPGGVFYLDPPYIQQGWQLYREQMTDGDHERLAAILRKVENFVLSYDAREEIERLYEWASIQEVETVYSTAKTRGAPQRARRTEVVIVPAS